MVIKMFHAVTGAQLLLDGLHVAIHPPDVFPGGYLGTVFQPRVLFSWIRRGWDWDVFGSHHHLVRWLKIGIGT